MKIILSYHAKKRLFERDIKMNQIQETIEMPDYTISKGNKKESYKKFGDKILKVVFTNEDNYIKVITLIWK